MARVVNLSQAGHLNRTQPLPFSSPWALLRACLLGSLLGAAAANIASGAPLPESGPGREDLARYFRAEVARIEARCLTDIGSLQDWDAKRESYRAQLRDMLGLEPLPPRSELHPVVTGRLEQEGFIVEKLHFQALPRLYVTANFYLPKAATAPLPAILYVCGHARVVTNNLSCGNKTGYQHHGAWFAQHGYACLMIDTVQLGEIEGVHHGTYRDGQWWWNSRGYTPAGVEAWFGIRALDYLCSRPEVDPHRIGMTGRSGGGSYTWTVAALDDRVKVAAPVAGITDLRNQVIDGVIDGHCDCMFYLNTYRWDFPQLAALLAPRPLLIANSDKDTIFPLEGVVRLHAQVRSIYQLHGAANKLGLLITEGPHADTQDLQLPVFRWFNRFLKGDDSLIDAAARKFADPLSLRVFESLPADQLNTRVHEWFGPGKAAGAARSGERPLPEGDKEEKLRVLREKVFGGWPEESIMSPVLSVRREFKGLRYQCFELTTQPGIGLKLHLVSPVRPSKPEKVVITVLDSQWWSNSPARALWQEADVTAVPEAVRREVRDGKLAMAFLAPRMVEPASWFTNQAKVTQVCRRYMLLGQTLDGMRVWDIRCAVRALRALPQLQKAAVTIRAQRAMAVNASYAALFEPEVRSVEAEDLPKSHLDGPDYLNVLRVWDLEEMLKCAVQREQ